MEDPSQNVPPALLAHIHLISSSRYPSHPTPLPLDSITDYLLKAPQIIRNAAAVSWRFIRPPSNGTIFLAWQPPHQDGFATDGYVWPSNETLYQEASRNCHVDIIVNECGYLPTVEQRASHRRTRYRLRSSTTGQPVDSNLEIVHYTASPPEKQLPIASLPPHQGQTRLMQQRQYLDEAGSLERKEFMFSDRQNWPKITMPGQRAPGMANPYGPRPPMPGMPGMGRPAGPSQPFFPPGSNMRAGMGQPPSKRQRTMPGPGVPRPTMPGAQVPPGVDTEMIDEESPAIGDFLDLLTPREISTTRYAQHHEWMEEILSSPYATHQILPDSTSFKLPGELSELTKDLFENPDANEPRQIPSEQVEEFEKRVAAFKQKGSDDIEAMKARHAQKMEELKTSKLFMDLERRLAQAPTDDSDGGATVKQIVQEAEQTTGSRLTSREDIVQVQKGGLLDRQEAAALRNDGQAKDDTQQQDEFGEFTNLDSAGEALDFYSDTFDDHGMTFENS